MPNLPPSCSNHSPFSGGISPFKVGQWFVFVFFSSSNSFLQFLCKEEADRDQKIISPPRAQVPLSDWGISKQGTSSLEGAEGGGGGLELWSSHRLVFPSSPPCKPQKPLKAQCKPALPGRAWGCEGGKYVGPGQPAGPIYPSPILQGSPPLGSPIQVQFNDEDHFSWVFSRRSMPGEASTQGGAIAPPSTIREKCNPGSTNICGARGLHPSPFVSQRPPWVEGTLGV